MRNVAKTGFLLTMALLINSAMFGQEYSPYIQSAQLSGSVTEAMEKVTGILEASGFTILGKYHPEGKSTLGVLVFTREDWKNSVIRSRDRGIHVAAIKAGFVYQNGKTTVSYTNPEYFSYAYLQDDVSKVPLRSFAADLKTTFRKLEGTEKPFGGSHSQSKLFKYRYMPAMEGFRNPVELATFETFGAGVTKIEGNLKRQKGNTRLIYSIVDERNQTAVFGVGLMDREKGEPHFLPIIGEEHAAALPYEIVLVGKEATMLHGRFRIALHWPDLTMGTFTKIMSTPGDIKDLLGALTE